MTDDQAGSVNAAPLVEEVAFAIFSTQMPEFSAKKPWMLRERVPAALAVLSVLKRRGLLTSQALEILEKSS